MTNELIYNSSGKTITECLNRYFGCNYESYKRVVWRINDDLGVWFVQLAESINGSLVSTSSMGWVNTLSCDEGTIYQKHPDKKRIEQYLQEESTRAWLIFTHEKGGEYTFKGVYHHIGRYDKEGFIYKRISRNYNVAMNDIDSTKSVDGI